MQPEPRGAAERLPSSSAAGAVAPKAAEIAARESSSACGSTLECSSPSVAQSEAGSTSGRVEAHWPSFVRHGPPRSSACTRARSNRDCHALPRSRSAGSSSSSGRSSSRPSAKARASSRNAPSAERGRPSSDREADSASGTIVPACLAATRLCTAKVGEPPWRRSSPAKLCGGGRQLKIQPVLRPQRERRGKATERASRNAVGELSARVRASRSI
mmetsp:Transcript_2332/g.7239  ORF Transcript_2332/g.7239 Transcript_2332/m.7239 type:complete len:215 (-) Transcript_2332:35-679(-)